jgi:hypothetical protein
MREKRNGRTGLRRRGAEFVVTAKHPPGCSEELGRAADCDVAVAKAPGSIYFGFRPEADNFEVSCVCPREKRGHSRDPDRGSEHLSSDRPILEGCRRFIGGKSPALAEKYRQVLPGRKWRTS